MMQTTLVLLCKRPQLGVGKQRLAASIGQESALQIADALLACVLEDILVWPSTVVIAPADIKDREWAIQYFKKDNEIDTGNRLKVLPQIDGNLGERLNMLDRTLRSSGFKRLMYIGSDSPQISLVDLIKTSEALLNYDTVFKSTRDGGVSIMANSKPWPDLSGLPWSTSQLGNKLFSLCERNQHTIANLSLGYDVDELDDLFYLVKYLANDLRPARLKLWNLARNIILQKTSKQKVLLQSESYHV